jgi:uncharacterized integral membrane protein (TIGR00698 family)
MASTRPRGRSRGRHRGRRVGRTGVAGAYPCGANLEDELNQLINEWKKIGRELPNSFPGLNLVVGVAIIARFLQGLVPGPTLNRAVSEILVAVLLGLYVRNALGVPASLQPGIKFALQRILRLGIILLGLRLSMQDVAAIGVSALLLVVVCITIALTLAFIAGRLFHIPAKLALLIGVGTAICGNSAIVATAPVVEAKEEDVSFAVATITLFGVLAVILYPVIGQALGLSDRAFGMWAGTAVNDTSQVVAVGAAYSPLALSVATVVKLTRNTLMAPLIVLIGLVYRRSRSGAGGARPAVAAGGLIPWFVLGFLALSLARTAGVAAGVLPASVDQPGGLQAAASVLKLLDEAAKFAILMALAAVGLGTDIRSLQRTGLTPLLVGLCVAATLAVVSLSLILLSGLG